MDCRPDNCGFSLTFSFCVGGVGQARANSDVRGTFSELSISCGVLGDSKDEAVGKAETVKCLHWIDLT